VQQAAGRGGGEEDEEGAGLDLGRAAASARRVMAMEEAMAGGGAAPREGERRVEGMGTRGAKILRIRERSGGGRRRGPRRYFLPRFLPFCQMLMGWAVEARTSSFRPKLV
jgi:hypothetical protein